MNIDVVPILFLLAASCTLGRQQINARDLSAVPNDRIILVGNIYVDFYGMDGTGRTLFELDGSAENVSTEENGDFLWVVDRPRSGESVRLSWMSSLDSVRTFGEVGPVIVPASHGSARCVYVGELKVRLYETRSNLAQQATNDPSYPSMQIQVGDEERRTIARIARRNRSLSGVDCADAAAGRVTPTAAETPPAR